MENIYNSDNKILEFVNNTEKELIDKFNDIEKIYEYNQIKVLNSFIKNKISDTDFVESTGYGYDDSGRDKIERLFSDIFYTEDSLVRQQIVSGTHAISLALFALTKPNDHILSINGLPYDTLLPTIGINNESNSLKENNVSFDFTELIDNDFDKNEIKNKINSNTKVIMIQRSRGYNNRKSLSLNSIKEIIKFIKEINKNIIILVDNCYGEFVDKFEPSDFGADIICGSLIKNPGGGLAISGGYISGKKELIEKCAYRLTSPSIGKEVGVNFGQNRNIFQGLYLAPQIVYNALKINLLFSHVLNKLNINTIPSINDDLNDIVLSIELNNEKKLIDLCNIIQKYSPINSSFAPVANDMPGYKHKVIMASGCFVQGSSIEFSCDAPIRDPYVAFLQGGLTYYQGKLALIKIISELKLL